MNIVLVLSMLLVLLMLISKNESFNSPPECDTIKEGDCNSKLCSANPDCKVKKSATEGKCICVKRE